MLVILTPDEVTIAAWANKLCNLFQEVRSRDSRGHGQQIGRIGDIDGLCQSLLTIDPQLLHVVPVSQEQEIDGVVRWCVFQTIGVNKLQKQSQCVWIAIFYSALLVLVLGKTLLLSISSTFLRAALVPIFLYQKITEPNCH